MQLRNLVVGRNAWILVEEKRRSVDPVRAAMSIECAVIVVRAGGRTESMCAPEVEPWVASYMDAFTRTSAIVSGAGVGMALPMER